ncbi:MAG: hypothetical protein WC756_12055 [Taibaiella sp.]
MTLKDINKLAAKLRLKRRQYYLHRCVKKFTRMNRKQKTIFVLNSVELTLIQKKYLNELVNKFHYALQSEIE